MTDQRTYPVDWEAFLSSASLGKTTMEYGANRNCYWDCGDQGGLTLNSVLRSVVLRD